MATKITEAFKALRKLGIIARQNFQCCGSCAGYAIATDITEMLDKGKDRSKILGCVFYHNQDAARFRQGDDFYLAFGSVDTQKYGEIGLPTAIVGNLICYELAKLGIKFTWNGDPNQRIQVNAADAAAYL